MQKAAYDMRMSDWSSDVCSSDLAENPDNAGARKGATMADVTITQEDDGRHGRYVARIAGIGDEAELTFTHRGPGVISADHTGAPESMRGTGAEAALVDFLKIGRAACRERVWHDG